jgi:hypothetical protein
MPGRRLESDVMDTVTGAQPITAPGVVPPGSGYEYIRLADRLHTVETDPNLLALPSAQFAQRTWMLANAHALVLQAEWQSIKLLYITMTEFAKLQKSLDREVDPVEVPLGPWVAMMRENMRAHIDNNRMSEDCLLQFELLHASLWIRIGEGRAREVRETMAALQTLFNDHAKLWLDYNACIPAPYRLKMADLFPWIMEKWVLQRNDESGPDTGFFRKEAVPEIMEHVATVYCESQ